MKIAVVAPSPVPFVIGGIENLVWSMCDYINQKTSHQAELIKLPSRELGFWELIDNYHNFYTLDLSHFDAVITSKYPGWMVNHPNLVYYVAHRLRGLYDTYHLMHLPYEVNTADPWVLMVLNYMKEYPQPANLDRFFELVYQMKEYAVPDPAVFSFPGPLIRLLVHYMDDFAFLRNQPDQYFSISKTVAARKEYFPEGADVISLYPPSNLKDSSCEEFRHVFMVSRLDAPKRIDLLVRAMKYVKSDIPLYIAGNGPEKQRLMELAGDDPRIRFLGFVTDEEVEKNYANALVIPYFPKEEDYGYITIEAMKHAKPVITLKDSGGPTEFVRDRETGFVVEGTPEAIAEKIDWFAAHPEEAKRMGAKARELVEGITWEKVCRALIASVEDRAERQKRKKATVLSTFPVWPPMGGGQARSFSLYRELSKDCNVDVLVLADKSRRTRMAPGYTEILCERTEKQKKEASEISGSLGIPAEDIAHFFYTEQGKEYGDCLREAAEKSDLFILSHPYTYFELEQILEKKPFIYEAQDVEYLIKQQMLPESKLKETALEKIHAAEKACCEKSLKILVCSDEDRESILKLYNVPEEKILVVPNGVNCSETAYTPPDVRTMKKKALGIPDRKTCLFMGSWHGPNLEACEQIFRTARLCPDTTFLLMGSQCRFFEQKGAKLPGNVSLLGLVSDEEKNRVFSVVDLALNPMLSGSGTNLKMFDYMAAGIPVITTLFGSRGIDRKDLMIIAEPPAEMAKAIQEYSAEKYQGLIEEARAYVNTTFDWQVIAGPLRSLAVSLWEKKENR